MPVCSNCGTDDAEGSRFCMQCGHALKLVAAASPSVGPSPNKAKKLCAGCRTANEPSAAYCYHCGLELPDHLYTEAEVIGSPAGFWIRAGAYMLDNVLLTVAGIIATVTIVGIEPGEALKQLTGQSEGSATTIITAGLEVAYFTFATGRWGQTVGKALLGLKVVRVDGSRLSYWRSFARYWAYLVSLLPLGLGFISIVLSSQKRGWHDFLCNTRVVNLRS